MTASHLNTDPRLSAPMRRHIRSLQMDSVEAYLSWCRENGLNARLNKTLAQRQKELAAARRTSDRLQKESDLAAHFAALGLGSVAAYQAWCRENGVGDGLQKSKTQRQQELQLAERIRSRRFAAKATASQHKRRRKDILKGIADGLVDEQELTSPVLLRVHHLMHHVMVDPADRAAFLSLLLSVEKNRRLFHLKPVVPRFGALPDNTFPDALAALALRYSNWIRPIGDWHCDSHNARRQFGALVRHLLARYDVPVCMDTAFFAGLNETARRQQDWFIHVGQGQNIRKATIPLHFTKRMAHEFTVSAPQDYTVDTALRWAQVIGMGGDELLAEAVCDSMLGGHLDDGPFWETVLHFFVNNPMLDVVHVGPIVDYIHHVRFAGQERRNPDGRVERVDPPEPAFTMKGRTPESLLSRVETWHRGLNRTQARNPRLWESCGISGFTWVDEDERAGEIRTWRIEEILSGRDLSYEGKAMKHCVASYINSCANGTRSIWSMKVDYLGSGATRNVLTIEVANNKRYIRQVRGRSNSRPMDAHSGRAQEGWEVLFLWANQEGLTLPGTRSWAMRRV